MYYINNLIVHDKYCIPIIDGHKVKKWKEDFLTPDLIKNVKTDKNYKFFRDYNIFNNLKYKHFNTSNLSNNHPEYNQFYQEVYTEYQKEKGKSIERDDQFHAYFYNLILDLSQKLNLLSEDEITVVKDLQEWIKNNEILLKMYKEKRLSFEEEVKEFNINIFDDYDDYTRNVGSTGEYIAEEYLKSLGSISNIISLSSTASGFGGDSIYKDNIAKKDILGEFKTSWKYEFSGNDINFYDSVKISFNEENTIFGDHDTNYNISELVRVIIKDRIIINNPLNSAYIIRAQQYNDGSKRKFKTGEFGKISDGDIVYEQGELYYEKNCQYPKAQGHEYVKSIHKKHFNGYEEEEKH